MFLTSWRLACNTVSFAGTLNACKQIYQSSSRPLFPSGPDRLWQLKRAGGGTCGSWRRGQGRAQERLEAGSAEFPHSSHHRSSGSTPARRRRGGGPGSLLLGSPGAWMPRSVCSRSAGHDLKKKNHLPTFSSSSQKHFQLLLSQRSPIHC